MSVWWSVGLSAGGLCGAWLLTERRRVGWLVYAVLNVCWVVYAVASEQWGFLPTSLVFIAMNARGYVRWRDDAPARREEVACER